MAIESASYVGELNSSNPLSDDAISHADDHIRLIKAAILATFPNLLGAVNSDHNDLNKLYNTSDDLTANDLDVLAGFVADHGGSATDLGYLSNLTGDVETRLTALETGGTGSTAGVDPTCMFMGERKDLDATGSIAIFTSDATDNATQFGFQIIMHDSNYANKTVTVSVKYSGAEKWSQTPTYRADDYGNFLFMQPCKNVDNVAGGNTGEITVVLNPSGGAPAVEKTWTKKVYFK